MFIVSVYQKTESEKTNKINHDTIVRSFKTKEVQGMYKGEKELSMIIEDKNRNQAYFLMALYNQECILYVSDLTKAAILIDKNYNETYIGVFTEIKENELFDNYTIIDGRRYTCLYYHAAKNTL